MVDDIKKLINEKKNYSQIGRILGVHRTTVARICKENNIVLIKEKNTKCSICDKSLGENKKNNTKCKGCVTRLRRLRIKIKSVEYLGGKCVKCGYDKHLAALTFHHKEPDKKEFNISYSKHSKSWTELKEELDKCVILCSNCHHIEHSKYDDEKLIKYL
jgi:hypothetical protein